MLLLHILSAKRDRPAGTLLGSIEFRETKLRADFGDY